MLAFGSWVYHGGRCALRGGVHRGITEGRAARLRLVTGFSTQMVTDCTRIFCVHENRQYNGRVCSPSARGLTTEGALRCSEGFTEESQRFGVLVFDLCRFFNTDGHGFASRLPPAVWARIDGHRSAGLL